MPDAAPKVDPARKPLRTVAGLVVAGLVVVAVVLASRDQPTPSSTPSSTPTSTAAAAAGAVRLLVGVGIEQAGRPEPLRFARPDEPLAPGELLLLRFTLAAAAWVHLYVVPDRPGPAGPGLLLFGSGATDQLVPPGAHDVTAEGQRVAIVPEEVGSPLTIVLVTAPDGFPPERMRAVEAALPSAERLRAACPACGVDALHVGGPAAR